ncbi:MAG: chemotaxis protein CheB, partial [Pseudomonadota bacterium]
PMPVVMLSSLTSAGSDAAIQALSGGAIDCILKPTDGLDQGLSQDICDRVYNAACTKAAQLRPREPVNAPQPASPSYAATASARDSSCQRRSLVLIGASTGGVSALETVLPHLAPDGPPVVIVQHMPGNFLQSFSERLQRQLAQNVGLAEEGVVLRRGDVVLAPGNAQHTVVKRRADGWYCAFAPNEPASLHCPSVDSLFKSAVSDARYVTAAILTGLGRDGAEGLLELSQNGAVTFGQNEETSVVYGMPRAAHAAGAVQKQLPIDKIGSAIREGVRRPSKTDRQQLTHEAPTP